MLRHIGRVAALAVALVAAAMAPLCAQDQKGTLVFAVESLGAQTLDPILEGTEAFGIGGRFEPFDDGAKRGVATIEMRLRRMRDEELASAGVLAGVRHRKGAPDVLVGVLLGLALDGVARATGACHASAETIAVRLPNLPFVR